MRSYREFRERLRKRAKAAGLTLDPSLVEKLEIYYQLLTKWNAKINLTAFKLTPEGDEAAIDRLLIEPVVAARYVAENARTLLDAGSGGGSPAIPLKLASENLHLRMVEVKTRKAVFLREAVRALGLRDAEVETSRFEELLPRARAPRNPRPRVDSRCPHRNPNAPHAPGFPAYRREIAAISRLQPQRARGFSAAAARLDGHIPACRRAS